MADVGEVLARALQTLRTRVQAPLPSSAVTQIATTAGTTAAATAAVGGEVRIMVSTATGQADVRLEGHEPVQSWRVAMSTSAVPADATVDGSAPQAGRAITLTNVATLALGATLYVKARAYSGAGGSGTPSSYLVATWRRDTPGVLTRTLLVSGAAFTPEHSGVQARLYIPALHYGSWPQVDMIAWTGNGAVTAGGIVGLPLPVGATITKWECLCDSGAAGQVLAVLWSANMDVVSTLQSGGAGSALLLASGALNKTVAPGEIYAARIVTTSTTAGGSIVYWVRVTYTVPDHSVGI